MKQKLQAGVFVIKANKNNEVTGRARHPRGLGKTERRNVAVVSAKDAIKILETNARGVEEMRFIAPELGSRKKTFGKFSVKWKRGARKYAG